MTQTVMIGLKVNIYNNCSNNTHEAIRRNLEEFEEQTENFNRDGLEEEDFKNNAYM